MALASRSASAMPAAARQDEAVSWEQQFAEMRDPDKELMLALAVQRALVDTPMTPLHRITDPRGNTRWTILPECHVSQALQDAASPLLRCCSHVSRLRAFCRSPLARQHGVVAGVATGFQAVLQDLEALLSTTRGNPAEAGLVHLSQKLQNVLRCSASLGDLAEMISELHLDSPAILNRLHGEYSRLEGRQGEQILMLRFLHAAWSPYLQMLQRWVCEGELEDFQDEFFIVRSRTQDTARPSSSTGTSTSTGAGAGAGAGTGAGAGASSRRASGDARLPAAFPGTSPLTGSARDSQGAVGSGGDAFLRSSLGALDLASPGPGEARGSSEAARASGGEGPCSVPPWAQGIGVRPPVPALLLPCAQQALEAGAYVQGLLRCGERHRVPSAVQLSLGQVEDLVVGFHEAAGHQFLDMARHKFDLVGRLNAARQLFFMSHGDWVRLFLEAADAQLCQPAARLDKCQIQDALCTALRSTGAADAPHLDSASCCLRGPHDLARPGGGSAPAAARHGQGQGQGQGQRQGSLCAGPQSTAPSGWDCFQLQYTAPWPVSVVLCESALEGYHGVSSLFLLWHRAHHALAAQALVQRLGCGLPREVRQGLLLLKSGLLGLLQLLQGFFMLLAQERWEAMVAGIHSSNTFHQVLSLHEHFLRGCQALGLRLQGTLHQVSLRICSCCSALRSLAEEAAGEEAGAGIGAGAGAERGVSQNGLSVSEEHSEQAPEQHILEQIRSLGNDLRLDATHLRNWAAGRLNGDPSFLPLFQKLNTFASALRRESDAQGAGGEM